MKQAVALVAFGLIFSGLVCSDARAANIAPLAFGMTPADATTALNVPLYYVRGRPGSEVFVATRDAGVPGFYPVGERVYLQFRGGRLTGWKRDWGLRRGWLF